MRHFEYSIACAHNVNHMFVQVMHNALDMLDL